MSSGVDAPITIVNEASTTTNGSGPARPRPDVDQTARTALDTAESGTEPKEKLGSLEHTSSIDNNLQAAHREAPTLPIPDINLRTKNVVVTHINRFCQMASQLEKQNPSAFRKDPLYQMALELQRRHTDFFKTETPPAQTTEKQSQVEKTYSLSDFTANERVILDGILRKATRELAWGAGVDIINPNTRIRLAESHTGGAYTLIEQGEKKSEKKIKEEERFTLMSGGMPVRERASLDTLTNQFRQLPNSIPTSYAETIRFGDNEFYSQRRRLEEIARLHNASIRFRESITGKNAMNALGRTSESFRRDRLSIEIKTQQELLLRERFPGVAVDRLSAEDRAGLQNVAITRAVIEIGGDVQRIIEGKKEAEYQEPDLIALARQEAKKSREQKTEAKIYKKTVIDENGVKTTEDISAEEYGEINTQQSEKKEEYDNKEKKLIEKEVELKELQAQLEALVSDELNQKATVKSATEQLKGFPVNFSMKNKVREYIEQFQEEVTTTDRRGVAQVVKRIPDKVLSHIEELSKNYRRLKDQQATAKTKLMQIETTRALIQDEQSVITDIKNELNDLQSELEELNKIQLTEEKVLRVPEVAAQIEFIAGTQQESPDVYSERLNHTLETFFDGQGRERSLESFDNLRNTLFAVESDLKGQEMARAVLSDEVIINSLAHTMNLTPHEWSLFGLSQLELTQMHIRQDGTVDWEKVSNENKRRLISIAEEHLLNRLRQYSTPTNVVMMMSILRGRLQAASQGKPTEFIKLKPSDVKKPSAFQKAPQERFATIKSTDQYGQSIENPNLDLQQASEGERRNYTVTRQRS